MVASIDQPRQTVTDLIYDRLYRQVIENELPPDTKLSEAEVARRLGVSRQPVRDAFYRLSQQGFLLVRPQRATLVAPISVPAVMQALFIRTALEVATVAAAAEMGANADRYRLDALLDDQQKTVEADDRMGFHRLDDELHRRICALAGHDYAWALIRDHKAHMDRIRLLSLSFTAHDALAEHRDIVSAIKARNVDGAVSAIRDHLSRIAGSIARIQKSNPGFFDQEQI
ncbi:GntR family transcriptional regulator [Martelella mediterranea]|uniref:GntR family transcriptional regulator n=1 Tax=Martelella mediterranea TaxID=293089 RepID=UPI001E42CCA8|nr:GntR family transcriptional regulator [Martelella mediterranea]MCD1635675.1 GntR family transcriptional regulator [Martelella mediterranea]